MRTRYLAVTTETAAVLASLGELETEAARQMVEKDRETAETAQSSYRYSHPTGGRKYPSGNGAGSPLLPLAFVRHDVAIVLALIGGQAGVFPATVVTASQGPRLGAAMDRGTRWLLAVVVTVVAFMVPTVVCGVWLLPTWLKDAPTCWAVASGLGVAVAALAALWGHGFATGDETKQTAADRATASGRQAIAFNGSVTGNVSTGDSAAPCTAPDTPRRNSTPSTASSPRPETGADRQPAPGSAVASGERSIDFNGSVEGDVSTGDPLNGGPRP